MKQSLIPALRYEDALAAMAFLCEAFGFERHLVIAEDPPSRIVHHAQLVLGGSMIMLGSARNDALSTLVGLTTPRHAGGVTGMICGVVADPDAHHERAKAAGARIIRAPYDNEGYPGRAYDARDPEGHCRNFSSFDPWKHF